MHSIWMHRFCQVYFFLVPRAGLEPAQAKARRILSPLRLPIPPPRHILKIYTPLLLFLKTLIKTHHYYFVEAAPGIEPGIKDLQSSALPLGHAALFFVYSVKFILRANSSVLIIRISEDSSSSDFSIFLSRYAFLHAP